MAKKLNKPVIDVTTGLNVHFNDNYHSISGFLKDMRKCDVLSREEEVELFKRIKKGDESAINELVKANQRFVFAVAKRFSGGDNLMDLVQVGNLGMLEAIKKFNPNKKTDEGETVGFLSFASWYIRREISFYLINNNGLVKKTNNGKTVFKLNKIKSQFLNENGRQPTTKELQDIIEQEYGIKIKDPSYLYDVETKYLSSSYGEGNDNRETFENTQLFCEKSASVNDYVEKVEHEHNKQVSRTLLGKLNQREKTILEYLFGIGKDREYTIEEVAEMLGVTKERVRQLKISSLNKLKRYAKSAIAV